MKSLGIAIFLLVVLITLNVFVFDESFNIMPVRFVSQSLGSVYESMGSARFFLASLASFRETVEENIHLQKEVTVLRHMRSREAELEEENEFLRQAASLSARISSSRTDARIYGLSGGVEGFTALLNRGSESALAVGDTVITAEGVLFGTIQDVTASSARVRLVTDPGFMVSVRVLETGVFGIMQGAGNDDMTLDLITQDDPIQEGQVLVSTGNDTIPASLIVGMVAHVELREGDVFKRVRVSPTFEQVLAGRVIVLGTGR